MAARRNFSGIWHSTYWYPSNSRPGELEASEYTMSAHQRGDRLILESLPNNIKSHLTLNLTVNEDLATGTWFEQTSPHGEFEGMVYSGAMQLIIDAKAERMDGQWVGIGREHLPDGTFEPRIYNGRWLLERAGEQETASARKAQRYNA